MDNSNRPQTGFILGKRLDLGLYRRRCEVIYGRADVEWRRVGADTRMLVEPLEDVCIVRCLDEDTTYDGFVEIREIKKDVYIYSKEIEGWVWWSEP